MTNTVIHSNKGFRLKFFLAAGASSTPGSGSWGLYSLVLKHNILDDLHFVLQHDHGFANYEISLGLTWKPLKWLTVRPNVCFDWISSSSLTEGNSPFGYNSGGAPQTT